MRIWGRYTRQLYNRTFPTIYIPRKTFRWKNADEEPVSSNSLPANLNIGSISELSDAINLMFKIGVPGAYALGLLVISSYLSSSGVPLLISDFLTTLWFITLAALIAFFAIFLAAIFFFPVAFIFPTSSKLLRYTSISRRRSVFNIQGQLKSFFIPWLTNHSIPFATLFAVSLAILLNLNLPTIYWLILAGLIWMFGSVLVILLMRHYSMLYKRCLLRLRLVLCARVLLYSLWKAFWAAWWAILLLYLLNAFAKFLMLTSVWLVAFTIYLCVIYFVSSRFVDGIRIRYRALMANMFIAFLLIILNPSYSGRMALQFLRIGGGIPVSIVSKTMMPGGKDIVAHNIEGCMILNAGSHIIVKILDHPTLDGCQTELSPSRLNNGEMLKGMEIISGSDVINLRAP